MRTCRLSGFPASALRAPLLVLAAAFLSAAEPRGQAPAEYPLFSLPAGAPEPAKEAVEFRTVDLDDQGLNRAIGGITIPTLTVYRPGSPSARRAAVVICPGGAYGRVAIDKEGHAVARFLRQNGILAAVLKYRLPRPEVTGTGLPLSQQDALAAIRFVREHAAEWGIDARRVGIMGFSAGGHLAGSTAFLGDAKAGTRPDFVALIYPVVRMDGPYVNAGSRKNLLGAAPDAAWAATFSLDRRVDAKSPPHFLIHARDDKGVPPENSQVLADALRAAGVPVALTVIGGGGHAFGLGRSEVTSRWPAEFVRWLEGLP